ncbi:hypothetical protein [Pseudarthrobacter sp. IC2-21]|uniref:hypothetical protein n=1 Tax=Pseudarthrobacter sp. IC2-21 TaxID=3092262 RepID=UPI002A6AF3D7|nr:hypothetical protein [Pseudarthrobacter sp. IC2-21]
MVMLEVAVALWTLARPPSGPAAESVASPSSGPAGDSPVTSTPSPERETPTAAPAISGPVPDGAPRTTDFRQLASAAATAIYSWDTRSASYSEVYSRVRAWWHVLPDGSNPLAVLVQEFEATGVNAGSFASLASQQAYRSASVESLTCDAELAKVREQPAPWEGLHVCTVSLQVLEQSTATRNSYTASVSVMVNCPPASTAPRDRCAMVAFYASPSRIVY